MPKRITGQKLFERSVALLDDPDVTRAQALSLSRSILRFVRQKRFASFPLAKVVESEVQHALENECSEAVACASALSAIARQLPEFDANVRDFEQEVKDLKASGSKVLLKVVTKARKDGKLAAEGLATLVDIKQENIELGKDASKQAASILRSYDAIKKAVPAELKPSNVSQGLRKVDALMQRARQTVGPSSPEGLLTAVKEAISNSGLRLVEDASALGTCKYVVLVDKKTGYGVARPHEYETVPIAKSGNDVLCASAAALLEYAKASVPGNASKTTAEFVKDAEALSLVPHPLLDADVVAMTRTFDPSFVVPAGIPSKLDPRVLLSAFEITETADKFREELSGLTEEQRALALSMASRLRKRDPEDDWLWRQVVASVGGVASGMTSALIAAGIGAVTGLGLGVPVIAGLAVGGAGGYLAINQYWDQIRHWKLVTEGMVTVLRFTRLVTCGVVRLYAINLALQGKVDQNQMRSIMFDMTSVFLGNQLSFWVRRLTCGPLAALFGEEGPGTFLQVLNNLAPGMTQMGQVAWSSFREFMPSTFATSNAQIMTHGLSVVVPQMQAFANFFTDVTTKMDWWYNVAPSLAGPASLLATQDPFGTLILKTDVASLSVFVQNVITEQTVRQIPIVGPIMAPWLAKFAENTEVALLTAQLLADLATLAGMIALGDPNPWPAFQTSCSLQGLDGFDYFDRVPKNKEDLRVWVEGKLQNDRFGDCYKPIEVKMSPETASAIRTTNKTMGVDFLTGQSSLGFFSGGVRWVPFRRPQV